MPFFCTICEEESTRICVRCTKDTCSNHICERCGRCSDCCECEVFPQEHMRTIQSVASVHHPEPPPEVVPAPAPEPEPIGPEPDGPSGDESLSPGPV